jgi:hypothetical protein
VIEKDKVYVPRDRIAFRKIAGKMVLVHTLEDRIVTLNDTATAIWENLDGSAVHLIASKISASFNVSEAEALKDTEEFLEYLLQRGFVIRKDESVK